ncbi:gliding motility-associated C-terminal domain-containing protein [Muricauda sp. SCSIO 64092]|uniref:Calx-beta domain-containing protein n=1 Tax=Allomuricauda sp. SCSIO 64092 TaxID=2908842 RepID=UPI001FF53FDE|nr:Calx-beta domain-containing protein [Muricauda sp. SCSIO 64092]UOY07489.1 gliding motility-associated C-terminal domain-containing protein [Muricauda sp. SCSIO 64092]
MKTNTYTDIIKGILCLILISITTIKLSAQVQTPFSPRYSETLNGDVTMIANNVLSRHPSNAYNGEDGNHDFSNNVFVDIDSDGSTFNSSSANLLNPEPSLSCLNFKKVLLYWVAADKEYDNYDLTEGETGTGTGSTADEPNWNYNQLKLMLPGQSAYSTITADQVIYRGRDAHFINDPYVCVKDITSDVQGLSNPYGTYQIANLKATEGDLYSHGGGHTGTSGGWQIVFVYENPSLDGKNITLFDGYVHIASGAGNVDFNFNGFQTVPNGQVNADIILGASEGDRDIDGDMLQIQDTNGTWQDISTIQRSADNFFNSKITLRDQNFTDRNPSSTNTLGFDAGVFELNNTGNNLIDNDQTSANLRITSDRETYGVYLIGLSVEVYEPSLDALSLTVATGSTTLNAGSIVPIRLEMQNIGNDNIRNLEIQTTLPNQLDFANGDLLPPGVTYSYDSGSKLLTFFIPDGMTDTDDPAYNLDFNVVVNDPCISCNTDFTLQASASFTGETNPSAQSVVSSGTFDECGLPNFDPTTFTVLPSFRINDVSTDEGNNLTFTITSSHITPTNTTFNLTYNNITTTDSDYSGPTSVVFPANASSATFNVAAIDDDWLEPDQTFDVTISDPTNNSLILDDQGVGTIRDTDEATITTSSYDVDEDAGIVQLRVALMSSGNNVGVEQAFTVDLTVNSTGITFPATDGSDYNSLTTTVSFPAYSPADTEFFVPLTILDDNIVEPSERIIQRLSNVSYNEINLASSEVIIRIHDNDTAIVSLQDINVNEDIGSVSYEFRLLGETQDPFDISFNTSDGTAIDPSDYSSTSGTVTFTGNTDEIQTVSLPIIDDTFIEPSESFSVNASYTGVAPGFTNAQALDVSIANNPGTVTINDNDGGAGSGIAVTGFTVNEDAGTATFDVALNADVQGGFDVDFAIADGSAIAPNDYTVAAANGTLSFTGTNGEVRSVTVTIIDDTIIEAPEDLNITLSGLTTNLINIVNGSATGTINDNDGGAGSGIAVTGFNVNEDAGTATFDVTLNADVQGGFDVDFAIADGSAIAPGDYTVAAANGTLSFTGTNGEVRSVTVTIIDDTIIEATEDLSITLSGLTTNLINIVGGTATGTINDNDGGAGSGIAVTGFTVDEDAGTATFDVALNADVQGGFDVDFAIADGSAIAPGDYTVAAANGTLSFTGTNGEVRSVTVTIIDDTLIEATEDLGITLSGLTTNLINIVGATATGNINDNDGGAGSGIAVTGFNVDEDAGTATFDVALNADVQGGFDVDFAIADGSAIAPGDYTVAAANGTLSFTGTNGEVRSVTVTIIDDTLIEATEDLGITLSGLTTNLINIVGATATGNINDNDGGAGSGIAVTGFTVNEDAGTATFDVALNADVQGGFDVDFAIADGSAIAPNDYTVAAANGTLSFTGTNGEVRSVTVTIIDDTIIEAPEDLSITLSGLTTNLINIVGGTATGTINDNDGGAGSGIAVTGFTVNEDAGTATFDVALNADVQGGFDVDFAIADGSAIAPDDYTVAAANGTLSFTGTNGEVRSVTVTIIDDTIIEAPEDLSITLSGLSTTLINIVGGTATGTINDNDGGAGSGIAVTGFNVDEDAGTATFDVALNADVQGGFDVDFAIADGSAIAPGDYTVASANGTLGFTGTNGEVHSVTVTIIDDTLIETPEDLGITLSGLTTNLINIVGGSATGTINDNDGGAGSGIAVTGFNVNEDAGTATFDVTLNADVQGGFDVDFAIADGSAIAPGDYTVAAANGTLSFTGNNGEVRSVTVTIIDDTLIETPEDLGITLSGLTTNLINIVGGTATGTINDNDGGAGSGIAVTGFNVNEDAGTATFDVTLNADVQGGFDVDFTIADGSAISPGDYTVAAANGTLSFTGTNGEVRSVTVTIIDDTIIEAPEDLNITLSGLTTSLINIVGGTATGTINDNDGGAGSGIAVTGFNVDEDAGTATFDVALNADVQGGFDVDFAIADGSAIAPGDYTVAAANGTLSFTGTNGEVRSVTVTIIDDTLIEATEDLGITLSGLTTNLINIVNGTATGTINDNDGGAGSGIAVTGFTVNEDAGTATFDVALNADVQGGFDVDFAIADGSAIAPNDYTVASANGTLSFTGTNGEVRSVTVTIIDDTLIEATEDLGITLSGLTTNLINIVGATATGTINDNDGGAGSGIAVTGFTVNEDAGTATFDVALNADVQGGFDVDFAIADGSAIAPGDYTVAAANGTLSFTGTNGEVRSVTVTIIDDTLIETPEDLNITLSGLTTNLINIVGGTATGTINDNDGGAGSGIAVTGFTVNEDAGTATFDVALNADVQGGFDVDFAIADGSAIAPNDYTVAAANGTLSFTGTNGEVRSVTVTIIDDTIIEAPEDLNITLSGLTTSLINIVNGTATGTINDNDGGTGSGIAVTGFNVDEDAGTATFDVALNADVQGGFDVDFAIADGSAIAPGDYTVAAANGTLSFTGTNGEVRSVTVTIIDDTLIEATEDLSITLSGLTTNLINIVNGSATGTINDNDGGTGSGIAVTGFNVDEGAGTATFDVALNADVQGGFDVDFAIADGSAIAPGDYTVAAANGTLSFTGTNGEVRSVTVTIIDDTLIETPEDLGITLSGLTTNLINIVGATATGNINDNDGGAGSGIAVTGFNVDEDAGTATFDVALNADVQGGFDVDFAIADGSAIAPGDYTVAAANGTLSFTGTNGEVRSVTVTIIDDTLIETPEDLGITLSGLTTNLINIVGATATGNINDNDGGAGSGIAVTGFNVDEDAGTATFDVALNADVQGGFDVDFAIADGSAIAPGDYTVAAANGTLSFTGTNGEVRSVTVTIIDDTLIETPEDLGITLSGLTTNLINIVGATATGNINDNDGGAGSGIAVTGFNVDEDAGTATFDVALNADVQGGFDVDFAIADGSAIAPGDYTVAAANGTLSFTGTNGEVRSVTVTIIDDTTIEATEDLSITLSGLTTNLINIVGATATGNINDNDGGAGSGIAVTGFTVNEDAGTATFDVALNADVQGGFDVDFAIADGSAIAPNDYTVAAANGTLSFTGTNGEVRSVTVTIIDDTIIEAPEDLSITLSGLTTNLINIVGGTATGTINDNDGGAGSGVAVTGFNVDEDAGTATFDVTLNADVQGGFDVDFAIADGSAIAPDDYTVASANGTLSFTGTNGEVRSVTVTIIDDTIIEATEDLSITLSGLTTSLINIVGGTATGTINDNDGGAGSGIAVTGFNVDEDAGTATFDVALNADVQGGFDVDFAIADGTAMAPNDYTVAAANGTLSFTGTNGEVRSVTVTIIDDTLIEATEDLGIALSGLTTNLINIVGATATGNINDNDGGAGSGIAVTGFNVNEDAGTATFDVTLNADVQGGFDVDFTIADGSAISPGDYTVAAANGTLSFTGTNGEVRSVTVTIIDDTTIEAPEDLSITLSGLTTNLINIVGGTATGTINDNDGGAGSGIAVTGFTVNEDAGTATFDVALNADVQGGFDVDFAIADGSAIAPGDYTVASANGTLSFTGTNGEVRSVTVTIIDDTLIEATEDLSITLSGLTTSLINIVNGSATGTINDNDGGAGSGVAVTGFNVNEGAGTATFDVTLNADVQGGFDVDFAIADGSAIAPGDYTVASANGTLSFTGTNGEVRSVTVTIIDDTLIEATEDLSITLSGLSTTLINIVGATATGTINDNDGGAGSGIAVTGFNVNEDAGTATFDVALNADVQGGFDVDFAIADGSAIAPGDYTVAAANGTLSFTGTNGEVRSVTVTIIDDTIIEATEDLSITLSGLTTSLINIVNGTATGNINDNDGGAGSGIAVTGFTVDEDAGTATFDVALNADVQGGFDVDFAIADGSAIAPGDYTVATANGTLSFTGTNGEVRSVTVTIIDDTLIEATEDLGITLSGLTTSLINIVNGTATGNINDNDGGAGSGIAVTGFTVNEGAGTATFDVALNADVQGGFDVDFAIADGTAMAPGDYTVASANGTLSFTGTNGEVRSVTVTIIDDTLIEATEDLGITLSGLTTNLINIVGGTATGNINDNDGGAGSGIDFVATDVTVTEGAGVTATFEVRLSGDFQDAFDVAFETAFGTATATDLVPQADNISFAGNDGEVHTIVVDILNDDIIEPTEGYFVDLLGTTNPLVAINTPQATGTILDDDLDPTDGLDFVATDVTVTEGAGVTATFEVRLSGDFQDPFDVAFETAFGTATATDLVPQADNISFAGNDGEVHTIVVDILNDDIIEPAEGYFVDLLGTTNPLVAINTPQATGTILDDDLDPTDGLDFVATDVTVTEGAGVTATFEVRLSGDFQDAFDVAFETAFGTATATDLVPQADNISFAGNDGEVHTIVVDILNDDIIEPTEGYFVDLLGTTNLLVAINTPQATGTILDDDLVPSTGIQFDNTNIIVTEGTDAFARFTVSLIGNIAENVTVDFVSNDGTALDGSDYNADSGTIVFTPTEKSFDIDIQIIDNSIIEPTEEFTVVLSNIVSNFGIGFVDGNTTNTATGTILDDDSNPSLGIQFDINSINVNEDVGTVTLNVVLNVDVQNEFTVEYHSVDGTATDVLDYTGIPSGSQTLVFGGTHSNTQTIAIPIIDDIITENMEDFNVLLSNISTTLVNILANDTAHINIIDNDGNEGWPEDITLEACDAIPAPANITSTSTCAINVDFEEVIDGDTDSCPTEYTITRTWTITDCVGNIREHVQVITIEDTVAPIFVEPLPLDMTVSCDNVPNADVLTAIDSCEPNMVVDFTETITGQDDSCPSEYTIVRTWSVADCAGNAVSHTQTIVVEDTQAPTFVETLPESMTVQCNAVPDAAVLTAIDNCDPNIVVTFDEVITNDANCANGYTVTRTWSTSDCAGNGVSHTQIITIAPTGPITASDYEEQVTVLCGDALPEVPELTFSGGCGNYTVVFNEVTEFSDDTDDYMVIRTWDVTDSCGNMASFEQIVFVLQPKLEEVFITICVEDDAIDLVEYLPESFDTSGTFTIVQGEVTMEGSMFNPTDLAVGEYLIAYTSTEGTCKYYVDFTIDVNSDCVPCGRNEIKVSKTVTANADTINDFFEITGVEYCLYTFEVMIFNRWGDKVFESANYENTWGGFAPNNSVGNSGMLPSGTYYYVIKVNERPEFEPINGFIYLGTE